LAENFIKEQNRLRRERRATLQLAQSTKKLSLGSIKTSGKFDSTGPGDDLNSLITRNHHYNQEQLGDEGHSPRNQAIIINEIAVRDSPTINKHKSPK